jgi:hypothetical protein
MVFVSWKVLQMKKFKVIDFINAKVIQFNGKFIELFILVFVNYSISWSLLIIVYDSHCQLAIGGDIQLMVML